MQISMQECLHIMQHLGEIVTFSYSAHCHHSHESASTDHNHVLNLDNTFPMTGQDTLIEQITQVKITLDRPSEEGINLSITSEFFPFCYHEKESIFQTEISVPPPQMYSHV